MALWPEEEVSLLRYSNIFSCLTLKKRKEKNFFDFSSKLSLRCHFVQYTYRVAKKKTFRSTIHETSTLDLTIVLHQRSKDSNKESSGVGDADRIPRLNNPRAWSDIFALRGKITRYNGDKLSRTFPLPHLPSRNNFYFRVERLKLPQGSPSGPYQSSRWPQERLHFEFGSNGIHHCNVTGSDNPPECALLRKQSHKIFNSLFDHLRHAVARVYKVKGRTHGLKFASITYPVFVGTNLTIKVEVN